MDDQLDNDLKNHIREVFDNYEDTTADEGWLLLREKFPPQQAKRRAIIWLWWSAAAILLVFLGVGLWLKNLPDKPVNPIVKKVNHLPKHENQPVKKVQPDTAVLYNIAAAARDKQARPNRNVTSHTISTTKPANNYQAASVKNPNNVNQPVKQTPAAGNPAQTPADAAHTNQNTLAVVEPPKPVAKKIDPSPADANVKAPAAGTPASPVMAQHTKPVKNIMDMFKNDKGSKQPVKNDDDVKEKKVHFGLYAGTYFNYSKGSDNQMNVGGGITSDIKLAKNLKLVTGITVAQNSLSYQRVPTVAASLKSNLAVPAAVSSATAFAKPAATPTIRNYNASLVGLDIPINIKYEFNPKKTDAYVSLGLSSGTFIDESYTYKYNYPSFQSSELQETKNETTGNNFDGFYFAKTLNVAFGIGYPFGKNRLVIEPFLKYPLDGLGSQNLRFGAGGLNLKFNFLSSHK